MTDLQFLVLALAILYLSECIYWVRRGSVVFRLWFLNEQRTGRGADVAHPSPGIGPHRTGVVPTNPLPPFGNAFIVHAWPLSMTAEAVCDFVRTVINRNDRPEHTGACIRWDDIWRIGREGEVILVNGKPFARCNHEPMARVVEAAMRRIQAAPAAEREGELARWLRRSSSTRRIRRELQRYRLVVRAAGLRWNAHVLFLVIFGLVPAVIGIAALRHWLLPSLATLVFLLVLQGCAFFWAHRRLFRGSAGTRWRLALTMIFTPTASIRACDALGRDLLAGYQPLAVALVLCKGSRLAGFARRVMLDLLHPMQPGSLHDDPLERSTVAGFHERMLATSEEILEEHPLSIASLTQPPRLEDPQAVSYCPRCDGEFLINAGTCEQCGGVELAPIAPSSPAAKSAAGSL